MLFGVGQSFLASVIQAAAALPELSFHHNNAKLEPTVLHKSKPQQPPGVSSAATARNICKDTRNGLREEKK
jgi:hypothetical protein